MFDAATINISSHAVAMYAQRRNQSNLSSAEAGMRNLMRRVQSKSPPIKVKGNHGPSRTYRTGDWVFITDADGAIVITCYPKPSTRQAKNRKRRKAGANR